LTAPIRLDQLIHKLLAAPLCVLTSRYLPFFTAGRPDVTVAVHPALARLFSTLAGRVVG